MWTQKKKIKSLFSVSLRTHPPLIKVRASQTQRQGHQHHRQQNGWKGTRTLIPNSHKRSRNRDGRGLFSQQPQHCSVTWQAQRHQPAHLLGVGGGFDEAAKHRAQPAPCLFVFMLCTGSKVLLRQVSAARQPHGKFASLCVYLTSRACCKRRHQLLLQRWVCMELSCTTEPVNMTWPLIVLHGRHSCTAVGWRYGCDRWCRLLLFTFPPYTYLSVPSLRVYSCR